MRPSRGAGGTDLVHAETVCTDCMQVACQITRDNCIAAIIITGMGYCYRYGLVWPDQTTAALPTPPT